MNHDISTDMLPAFCNKSKNACHAERSEASGSRSKKASHKTRILPLVPAAVALILVLCATSRARQPRIAKQWPEQFNWHINAAEIRFWAEQDDAYPQPPAVHLFDLKAANEPGSWKKYRERGLVSGRYYRLAGRIYEKGLPGYPGKAIAYDMHRQFGRFVAFVGIDDRANSDDQVDFEVRADNKPIFESQKITRKMPPVVINVPIPTGTKQLKIITNGANKDFISRWVRWVDAGFLLKGRLPNVSHVNIYPFGAPLTNFHPVVVAAAGKQVAAEVLSTPPGGPMEILFDSSKIPGGYFVYLVPKAAASQKHAEWQPKAGLTLETRYTNKSSFRDLKSLLQTWKESAKPIGKSLVHNLHQGYPIHWPDPADPAAKAAFWLYRYEGYFETVQPGEYTFAAAATGDSYLLVDGKTIVNWPGKHTITQAIRGQKRAKLSLQPGVHKIEFYNAYSRGKMAVLAAWAKPKANLNVMTADNFLPVARFAAKVVGYKTKNAAGAFRWRVTDTLQTNDRQTALVKMRFDAVETENTPGTTYRWRFDDKTTAQGKSVEHVFLKPAMRKVTLEVINKGAVIHKITNDVRVSVSVMPDTKYSDPDAAPFEKAVAQADLARAPLDDLICLYTLAEKTKHDRWKRSAADALISRAPELAAKNANPGSAGGKYADLCSKLLEYLISPTLRRYDRALTFLAPLAKESPPGTPLQNHAIISQAELLTRYLGNADAALKVLAGLTAKKSLDKDMALRYALVRAQALIATDKVPEATDVLNKLAKQTSDTGDKIKHIGMLRHARQLAQSDDLVQLAHAAEKIETIIAEDPTQLLTPNLNIIKLDIHLAADESQAALHLTRRLQNLEFNDYYRAEILARQVIALCRLRRLENAKAAYETIKNEYPLTPAAAIARKAIVDAASLPRKP